MLDKIKDRLSKLLNMTVKNGCSEDEQEVAMRMAASLATKHGIELESVRPKDAPKPKAKAKFRGDALKPHQAYAAKAAAELYGIECLSFNLGHDGIQFVGREDLIELAETTMFWLFNQVEALYKQSLPKGMTQQRRAEYRKTFKAACALRTLKRAQEHMKQMKTNEQAAQVATGSTALVVASYFTQLKAEINEYWDGREAEWKADSERQEKRLAEYRAKLTPEQQKTFDKQQARAEKPRRGRSMPVGIGTDAGYAAGDRVQLRKEVA